jgi:hypothetical protein
MLDLFDHYGPGNSFENFKLTSIYFISLMWKSKDELMLVQQMFFSNNFNQNESKFVQLKVLFDKIVLSICKCRKKLAHEECFNNYIDSIQSGNVNILISCAHCNLKYEFNYPYNGIVFLIRFLS